MDDDYPVHQELLREFRKTCFWSVLPGFPDGRGNLFEIDFLNPRLGGGE